MPLFYFILKTGREKIPDREGFEFANDEMARAHATAVAEELMRNRETMTRAWQLEVRDEDLQPCFELLFGEMDKSFVHEGPYTRESVAELSRSTAKLFEVVDEVRTGLSEVMAQAEELMKRLRVQPSGDEVRTGLSDVMQTLAQVEELMKRLRVHPSGPDKLS